MNSVLRSKRRWTTAEKPTSGRSFELKRVIFESERKILVRGFGLADRNSHDDSRIVIVLEEVTLSAGTQGSADAGLLFQKPLRRSPRNQQDVDPKTW